MLSLLPMPMRMRLFMAMPTVDTILMPTPVIGIPTTIITARGLLMLSLLLMPLLTLMPMLLCTVIPMVHTILMPTLLTATTGIPMPTVPSPTTITSARGRLMLRPTTDMDTVATDTTDRTDTTVTTAVRLRTWRRQQNFTVLVYVTRQK